MDATWGMSWGGECQRSPALASFVDTTLGMDWGVACYHVLALSHVDATWGCYALLVASAPDLHRAFHSLQKPEEKWRNSIFICENA